MKIAVATPTGHVGSAVVDFLLEFGGDIRVVLLGRRPDRLKEFVRRGAEMAIGSQDDADYLVKATRGVEALFWATPPGYGSDNVRAFQNRLGRAAATAIRTNKIPRVVNLSSIGAHLDAGVGPIGGLHDVEGLLNEAATHITHLRPGFFFENLLWQLDPIRKWGHISLPISGDRRYPMLATRDIGRVAAARLASRGWIGHFVGELHGPADLSFDEVAGILADVLGRKVEFVKMRSGRDAPGNAGKRHERQRRRSALGDVRGGGDGTVAADRASFGANDHAHHARRVCPGDNPAAVGRAGDQLAWDRPLGNVAGTRRVPAAVEEVRARWPGPFTECAGYIGRWSIRVADFQNRGVRRLPKLVNRVAVFRKCRP